MKFVKYRKRIIFVVLALVLFVPICLIMYLLFEGARTIIYFYGIHPKMETRNGIDIYSEQQYLEFDGGTQAEKYLPDSKVISEATYADFIYIDNTSCQTYFKNGAIAICIGLEYEDDALYELKKNDLADSGATTAYFNGKYTICWLIKTEKLSSNEYLYYFAICSDDTNGIVYAVCIDDQEHGLLLEYLDYATHLTSSDFWAKFIGD